MIFTSQKPNTDPEPWVAHDGTRSQHPHGFDTATVTFGITFDPRDEFTPTRDPEPWVWEPWITSAQIEHARKVLARLAVLP